MSGMTATAVEVKGLFRDIWGLKVKSFLSRKPHEGVLPVMMSYYLRAPIEMIFGVNLGPIFMAILVVALYIGFIFVTQSMVERLANQEKRGIASADITPERSLVRERVELFAIAIVGGLLLAAINFVPEMAALRLANMAPDLASAIFGGAGLLIAFGQMKDMWERGRSSALDLAAAKDAEKAGTPIDVPQAASPASLENPPAPERPAKEEEPGNIITTSPTAESYGLGKGVNVELPSTIPAPKAPVAGQLGARAPPEGGALRAIMVASFLLALVAPSVLTLPLAAIMLAYSNYRSRGADAIPTIRMAVIYIRNEGLLWVARGKALKNIDNPANVRRIVRDASTDALRPIVEKIRIATALKDEKLIKRLNRDYARTQGQIARILVEPAARMTDNLIVTAKGFYPQDVQGDAGREMARGGIVAGVRTGIGKSLTAIYALGFHAMAGNGSRLMTINDSLITKDLSDRSDKSKDSIANVYRLMGVVVGWLRNFNPVAFSRFIDTRIAQAASEKESEEARKARMTSEDERFNALVAAIFTGADAVTEQNGFTKKEGFDFTEGMRSDPLLVNVLEMGCVVSPDQDGFNKYAKNRVTAAASLAKRIEDIIAGPVLSKESREREISLQIRHAIETGAVETYLARMLGRNANLFKGTVTLDEYRSMQRSAIVTWAFIEANRLASGAAKQDMLPAEAEAASKKDAPDTAA
jgi:hypothetical protein